MPTKMFFISHENRQMGPWMKEQILEKLNNHELLWVDYIYDEQKSEWVTLIEHPLFSHEIKNTFNHEGENTSSIITMGDVTETSPDPLNEKQWFLLKEHNKYGPFTYLELIQSLQKKQLFEYDFVWNEKIGQWKKVSEISEFSHDNIKKLKESNSKEIEEIFFRRRFARARFGGSLILHNNKQVWKARALEIGAGGASFMIPQPDFSPGDSVFLHFKAGDGVPPFNALCRVVSRNSLGLDVKYGVEFINISQNIQKAIRSFTEKPAA